MRTITDKQYKEYVQLKKKRGFIDRCYRMTMLFICLIVSASYVAVVLSGFLGITDMEPLTTTIEKSFELAMVYSGFVVWKAKVENCRKHKDVNKVKELEDEV